MSSATQSHNRFVDPEVVDEENEGRVKSAQKKQEKGFGSWKIYIPVTLFVGSLCAGFYALVIGSGMFAMYSIGAFLVAVLISVYLGNKFIHELLS